jgi:hypothetical protein
MPDLRVSFPKPCDETWEAMTPSGCDRVCARCDHVVHDLSQYTLAEAEALLGANPGSCVRAQIGADGAVALKPGRGGKAGRMMIAVAATAGLLAAAAPGLCEAGASRRRHFRRGRILREPHARHCDGQDRPDFPCPSERKWPVQAPAFAARHLYDHLQGGVRRNRDGRECRCS